MNLFKKDLMGKFDNVYFKSQDIPFGTLNLKELEKKNDGFNFFRRGDLFKYIISPFEKTQPLSYIYLSMGEFFYAVKKTTLPPQIMGDITRFGIIINDRVYYIYYTEYTYESEKDGFTFKYIPLDILNSWLYRAGNWYVAEDRTMNVWKSTLPSSLLMPMHTLIEGFADENKKALPQYTKFLEEKFNCSFRQSYQDNKFNDDTKYFELRNLLDTRSNRDWSEGGFQLFVSSHNNERNVYVIKNADVFSIKKLINPAEAIDHYAAHIFSGNSEEFDFMQYAEDF